MASVLNPSSWIMPDQCQIDDTVPLWVALPSGYAAKRGREADVGCPRRFSPGWGFGQESSDISAGSGRPAHYWGNLVPLVSARLWCARGCYSVGRGGV